MRSLCAARVDSSQVRVVRAGRPAAPPARRAPAAPRQVVARGGRQRQACLPDAGLPAHHAQAWHLAWSHDGARLAHAARLKRMKSDILGVQRW